MINNIIQRIIDFLLDKFDVIDRSFSFFINLIISIYTLGIVISIWSIDTSELTSPISGIFLLCIQIFITIIAVVITFYIWSKKDEQTKYFRNIIVSTTFLLIFSFPVTYSILYLGKSLSLAGNFQIGSADGWLGFIGSLLGGLITMLALVFTIQHEKLLNSLKSIPRIKIKLKDSFEVDSIIINANKFKIDSFITLELENISSFDALNFMIKNFAIGETEKDLRKKASKDFLEELNEVNRFENVLSTNECRSLIFKINNDFKSIDHLFIRIEYEFYDYLKFKKYKFDTLSTLKLNVINPKKLDLTKKIGKNIKFKVEISSTVKKSNNRT